MWPGPDPGFANVWGGRIWEDFGRFFVRLAVGRRPGRLVIWGLKKTQQKTRDTSPKTWRNWTKNLETYPEKHSPQLQKNPCPYCWWFRNQTTIWDVYKTPVNAEISYQPRTGAKRTQLEALRPVLVFRASRIPAAWLLGPNRGVV